MSGLGTVYKKELRENLRDRRSLFNSVFLGPILFPILFIGLFCRQQAAGTCRGGVEGAGGRNRTRTQPGQFP